MRIERFVVDGVTVIFASNRGNAAITQAELERLLKIMGYARGQVLIIDSAVNRHLAERQHDPVAYKLMIMSEDVSYDVED